MSLVEVGAGVGMASLAWSGLGGEVVAVLETVLEAVVVWVVAGALQWLVVAVVVAVVA